MGTIKSGDLQYSQSFTSRCNGIKLTDLLVLSMSIANAGDHINLILVVCLMTGERERERSMRTDLILITDNKFHVSMCTAQ